MSELKVAKITERIVGTGVTIEQLKVNELVPADGTKVSINAGSLGVPSAASPPSNPDIGDMYYDTTLEYARYWNGASWDVGGKIPESITGGTITTNGPYTVHTFTTSQQFIVVGGEILVEYLVISGGGSGCSGGTGAGGGGGGFRTNVPDQISGGNSVPEGPLIVPEGQYWVEIGAGGPHATAGKIRGSESSFYIITSVGGGGGGQMGGGGGGSGGSGGGGSGRGYNSGTATTGGAATSGQGMPGGEGYVASGGGGGGGSVTPPQSNHGNTAGQAGRAGGAGQLSNIIDGTSVRYSGGGSGMIDAGYGVPGGAGGGGASETNMDGILNTGGGGGANNGLINSTFSGAGGSGIIILRYLTPV